MRGLDALVSQGKVLDVGVSDTPAWVVSQANTLAEMRGWARFIGLQIRYSLIDRTVERELLPMARALDIAVTPWGIVGGGILSGKYNDDAEATGRAKEMGRITDRALQIAAVVQAIAKELGATPTQVAIAWVRRGEGNIIPLVGARTVDQLRDNMGTLDVVLDDSQMDRLKEVSKIRLGFPTDMLRPGAQDMSTKLDNHRSAVTPEW